MDLLSTFMIHPVTLARWQQLLMLLPLCLCVSVVYKTTRCATLRELPLTILVSWGTIVLGMFVVGAALLAVYSLAV